MIHDPAFSGAHNRARVLDGPLRVRGIETLVALPEETRAAADRLRAAGTETVQVPLHRLHATLGPRTQLRFLATALPVVRRLGRLIAEHRIDIVQSLGAANPHGAIAARRSGAASVWQLFHKTHPDTRFRILGSSSPAHAGHEADLQEEIATEHRSRQR